ncbi:MAG: hypothetical protein ACK5TR_08220 [Alphaproteobacteria bacterium]|jgi:hypothetical protein|nr:hypothetical protein [Alphaproteobacteria bacterium]
MRKLICPVLALAMFWSCAIPKAHTTDDQTDAEERRTIPLIHPGFGDEDKHEAHLAHFNEDPGKVFNDEEANDSKVLLSSSDAENLLPFGLLNDSGAFMQSTPVPPTEEVTLAPSQKDSAIR